MYRFKNMDDDWEKRQWLDMTEQHFIVWMRAAGIPNFRKFYGVIHRNLEPGTYYVLIENNFETSYYSGTKKFVLTTTNLLGG